MNLLFILPEISGGGIATYYKNFLRQLNPEEVKVKVILANESDAEVKGFVDHVQVERISKELLKKNRTRFCHLKVFPLLHEALAMGWAIYEQAEGGQDFDLVELTDYPALFIPWLIQQENIPVIIRLAGSLGQIELHEKRHGQFAQTSLLQVIERICLNQANGLISLSFQNKKYWEERLNKPVLLLPPFFNPRSSFANYVNDLLFDKGLVVGRVQTWKGAEELCQAASILGDQCPVIEWVGADNYFREHSISMSGYLKKRYPVWGSRINHLGKGSHNFIQQKISQAKFLIAPSLWDTFNFSVLEGMAQGKVVICADGVGVAEHIQDGINGFVYPSKDIAALAKKIKIVSQLNKETCKLIGENAKKTVNEVFFSSLLIEKRMNLYREAIKQGPFIKEDPELFWLNDWISPESPSRDYIPDSLLDLIPLKYFLLYLKKRLLKKMGNNKR